MGESPDSELSARVEQLAAAAQQGPQSRAEIDRVVAELGAHLGLDRLELNEDGVAALRIDRTIDVTLAHFPHLPGLIVAIPITEIDAGDVRHLKMMLQANMSWQLTHGGIFSSIPGTDDPALVTLLLTRGRSSAEIDRDLAAMVESARAWRSVVENPPMVESDQAEPKPSAPAQGIINA